MGRRKRVLKTHARNESKQTLQDLRDMLNDVETALGPEAEVQFVRVTMKGKIRFIEFVLEDDA